MNDTSQYRATIRQFFFALLALSIPCCLGQVIAQSPATNSAGQSVNAVVNDPEIEEMLEKFLEGKKFPGAIAAIAERGKPLRIAAAGVRKSETEVKIQPTDMIHIGSCTKAMTASLAARFVERDKISWNTTVEDIWPKKSKSMHEDCRSITLRQLLRHRSGLKPNLTNREWRKTSPSDFRKARSQIAAFTLQNEPNNKPGTQFEYSNLGYIIAGAMLEIVSDKPWEDLMIEEIFAPLKISTGDFGIVGTTGKTDQPWGHRFSKNGKLVPLQIDNPRSLGPAGTVKMTVTDWAKFVLEHGSDHDTDFLSDDSLKALHENGPTDDYAMGWHKYQRRWAGGDTLMHNGSNTSFYSLVWFAPKQNRAYLVVMNCFDDETRIASDQIVGELLKIATKK